MSAMSADIDRLLSTERQRRMVIDCHNRSATI